jgi:hypothetical protein
MVDLNFFVENINRERTLIDFFSMPVFCDNTFLTVVDWVHKCRYHVMTVIFFLASPRLTNENVSGMFFYI